MISIDPPLVALFSAIRANTPEPDLTALEADIEARRAEARNTFIPVTGTHKVMHDLQISVLERALGGTLFP